MITPGWCHIMARYNAWQNANLLAAAETLSDAERRADRGAWFGSIHGTFAHLLWADLLWMSRFDGGPAPGGVIADSAGRFPDWGALRAERAATDARILGWAGRLEPDDVEGELSWHSASMGRDLTMARAICITQLFNHQTHHRGQVHAMLTAAGARPGVTDLPFLPEAV
jgi:uncharacterized damage-inducible protein DinB